MELRVYLRGYYVSETLNVKNSLFIHTRMNNEFCFCGSKFFYCGVTVSHTPQDLSIASTLLRSTVSVICAPFFIEAICFFASFIASNVSFFDIVFSCLLCCLQKYNFVLNRQCQPGKKHVRLCNKSVLSRYIYYI